MLTDAYKQSLFHLLRLFVAAIGLFVVMGIADHFGFHLVARALGILFLMIMVAAVYGGARALYIMLSGE